MIRLENVCVSAGKFALRNLNFLAEAGSYHVLMGKTGSGKTTILELLCCLKKPDSGQVFLGEKNITHASPGEVVVGYVPQDLALFPTLTVAEHLGFALSVRGESKAQQSARIQQLATELGIAHLLGRLPTGLSGGEAQRVALGRALAAKPAVLLLDEPLSSLDDETRTEMIGVLRSIHQTSRVTVLHVTHSQQEAEQLTEKRWRIENGELKEAPAGVPQSAKNAQ